MVFGGARVRPTIGKRIKQQQEKDAKLHTLIRRLASPSSSSLLVSANAGAGPNIGGSSNFLPTAGGAMAGSLAFLPQIIILEDGEMDISPATGQNASRVIISAESGTADDLLTITGRVDPGQLLNLQSVATHTITIKHNAGGGAAWVTSTAYVAGDIVSHNSFLYTCILAHTSGATDEPGVGGTWETKWFKANIRSATGADLVLNPQDNILLIFDAFDGNWTNLAPVADATSAGSEVFTWTANHDTDGFDLIIDNDGDSRFDFSNDDVFSIYLASILEYTFSGGSFSLNTNYVEMTEQAAPGTPAGNDVFVYAKDTGGTSSLWFIDDAGTEHDLGVASAGANLVLSNLTAGMVAINTSLKSDTDGIDDLGSGSFFWDHLFINTIVFDDAPVNAAETSIGQELGNHGLWFNQTEAADPMTWLWDDVEVMGLTPTGILQIQGNAGAAALNLTSSTRQMIIQTFSNIMLFTNDAALANRAFQIGDLSSLEGERLWLTGTGNLNTEFRFRTDQATTTLEVARIMFEGHDDAAGDVDYGSIRVSVLDPAAANPSGTMAIRVADSVGGENDTFILLDGSAHTVKLFENLVMQSADIDIGGGDIINTGTLTLPTATGIILSTATAWLMDDGVKATFNPNASVAGINVGQHSGQPSVPVNGDIIYNSSTNEMQGYINGAWTVLSGGGGAGDKISEGDSFVEVVDLGTGQINFQVDGVAVASWFNASGLIVSSKASFNADVVIGNADTDKVTMTAQLASHIIPDTHIAYDIGQPAGPTFGQGMRGGYFAERLVIPVGNDMFD